MTTIPAGRRRHARRRPSRSPAPAASTTHFSVVDKWGNVVSYTNTIESSHGAGMFAGYYPTAARRLASSSFGFLLNNELTDFNFTPHAQPRDRQAGRNDVAPGKRPRSSMVPTMIFDADGKPSSPTARPAARRSSTRCST